MAIKFYDVKPKNLRSEWENILPLLTKVNALEHYMTEEDWFEMAYTEKLDCKFWIAKDDDITIGIVNTFIVELPRGNCSNKWSNSSWLRTFEVSAFKSNKLI